MNCSAGKVGVPRQLVIKKDASSIPDAVGMAGLRLPLGVYLMTLYRFLCAVNFVRIVVL